ncbi:MAG: hypothetical protein IPK26_04590 [Planctomycetes bacterium]|nr:hypothetical protein [Planctomycetota bacterium]
MSALPPETETAPRTRWPLACTAVAFAWLLSRLPFLLAETARRQPDAWLEARAAIELAPDVRIRMATGLTPAAVTLLREAVPADGRIVLFCPYPGREMEGFLRNAFEKVKNLLYPKPRAVYFAQGAPALGEHIRGELVGKVVILDGTQENAELPAIGEFALLGEVPIGDRPAGPGPRLRIWRLVKVPQ